MTLNVTGQKPKSHISKLAPSLFPVVGDAVIAFEGSSLNRKELSGKQHGSMVVVTEGHDKGIYIATGDSQQDKWIYIPGKDETEVGKGPVRELVDMVDVEFAAFENMLELTESRIDTRVIETPMLLMDGSYGFRCHMTFTLIFRKKAEYLSRDEFTFLVKLINVTGSDESYYIVDHVSSVAHNISNAVLCDVDVSNARTNGIPVTLRTAGSTSDANHYVVNFAVEWTATEPIAEG